LSATWYETAARKKGRGTLPGTIWQLDSAKAIAFGFFDESEQGSAIVRDSHSAFRQEREADVIARMKAEGLPRAFGPRNDKAWAVMDES
jgi:hypothetical protein